MIDKSKKLLFERQATIARAIAHPVRIAVVDYLKEGEQCVCDIAEYVGSERTNVSKHLAVMTAAGVLESRKEGLKVIYRLKTPCILQCLESAVACIKKQVEESQRIFSALPGESK